MRISRVKWVGCGLLCLWIPLFMVERAAGQAGSVSHKGGFTVDHRRGKVQLKWRSRDVNEPPYKNEQVAFKIRYRVYGAIGQYPQRDVLYWKPLFNDRQYVIGSSKVILRIPEPTDQMEVVFYTESNQTRWRRDEQDGRIINFTGQQIATNDNFEIEVSLPKGMLEEYISSTNLYYYNIRPFIYPGVIIGVLIILYLVWLIAGRDPRVDDFNLSQMDVLNIPPGLAGILFDERFDNRDITATIMDFARRGYISVHELSEPTLLKKGTYEFKVLKIPQEGELSAFEAELMRRVFCLNLQVGQKTKTYNLENSFYQDIPVIKDKAWRQVELLGWFKAMPRVVKLCFGGVGFFTTFSSALFFIVYYFSQVRPLWQVDVGILLIITGCIIGISGRFMARKSFEGSRVYQKLCELRDSMKESKTMGLSVEDLLPWAIAFGVTKDLMKGITDPAVSRIHYYHSNVSCSSLDSSRTGSIVDLSGLADNINSMTSSIGST
ncbi:MAG: DUF2207 domain-containing protein, partial [Planctomycetes bacterium]|nr:DUF2207 domain-containing protein [Planctomycetota bacterium]